MPDGNKSSALPERADKSASVVILTRETWDQLVRYVRQITPKGDGQTTKVRITSSGTIISLITNA